MAVEGLVTEKVGDLPGEVPARVRAAGPSKPPTAALPAAGARYNKLVDVALLLLESSGGATGLSGVAASSEGSTQGACGTITIG